MAAKLLAACVGIGLHVDNCLGGFLATYLLKCGLLSNRLSLPDCTFDFSILGVTTMSVDVHKYDKFCISTSHQAYSSCETFCSHKHSFLPLPLSFGAY